MAASSSSSSSCSRRSHKEAMTLSSSGGASILNTASATSGTSSVSTASGESSRSSSTSFSSLSSSSSSSSSFSKMSTTADEPDIEATEYDTKQPLYILFLHYVRLIESLHPYSLLTQVKRELRGYKDCVELGPNKEDIPAGISLNTEDFYRWDNWRSCTVVLEQKAWTPNKFKEAAIKAYTTIARKYLIRLSQASNVE